MLLAIWMISVAFVGLAMNVKADDVYINNQTRIHLNSNNYPGGIAADWYYPGDTITGWLEGRPTGGLPPPADGLLDILDVVVADDDGIGGCNPVVFANRRLQADNIALDPITGTGTFSFPGTSTQFLSDGYYCAWVAPGDYLEGVSLATYAGNIQFQIHEYRIQASTDRGGYIPGNTVKVFYTVSRIKDGSPMTMTGYQSNWIVQATDGLTYAWGTLSVSAGQFNFTISNNGGVTPPESYPTAMWFNSTSGGAVRKATSQMFVQVGNLVCNIVTPGLGASYVPGAVMEVDVNVVAAIPLGTSYNYPGAVVFVKLLDGGTPASPEIPAYTRLFTSDGAGNVKYAFVLDPAVFLDGRTYTVLANATSILKFGSDWTTFNVRKGLETMSVRLTLDRASYYSDESAVLTVAAQPPPGHSSPSTYLYTVTSSGGAIFARESSSSSTYTFHIPRDFQGTLTFRADVYNTEGDYGWDDEQKTVNFGALIVNVNPGQYNANDQLAVSFELKSAVMTGSTTSFYYTASDGMRIVKQAPVDTGGTLLGSFLFTVPSVPATTYTFTVFASGNGHVVSGSRSATLIQGFILSISLDKESYLPGETIVVTYSIVPRNPATPLPRLLLFNYGAIGLPTMSWQTSEASGTFNYAIPQNANEGNVIFQVSESYTGATALEIFLIGTPSGPTVPSAPLSLQATPGNGRVNLTWTAPVSDGGNPIVAYRIYRGTTSGGETFLVEIGNVLSYTDSGVINGQTYCYVLSAKNSIGEGANSTEAMATPVTVPLQPLALQATAGYHLVTLTWAAPSSDGGSAITGYRIYRGTSGGSETLLASVGNTSSYTDTGLTAGQAYYYEVAAVNAAGEGAMSSEASATPSSPPSEVGTAGTPANESVSLVLVVLAIIILTIAAVLMFANLRKMRQHTEEVQTEEKREPGERQK